MSDLESTIESLLETLEGFSRVWNRLSPELQEQWYLAEMEARVGKDRETAKTHIEAFIRTLQLMEKRDAVDSESIISTRVQEQGKTEAEKYN